MTKYNNTQLPFKMRIEIYAPDQDLDYDHDECAQMTGKFKMVQEAKADPPAAGQQSHHDNLYHQDDSWKAHQLPQDTWRTPAKKRITPPPPAPPAHGAAASSTLIC